MGALVAWVKLDDLFPDHPKVLEAGPMAAWLYVCGLTYANRHLTDGFIPDSAVPRLADLKNARKLAAVLVRVRLWERAEGGYLIHDYLAYQPASDKVGQEREANAARVAAWKRRQKKPTNEEVTPLPEHYPMGEGNGSGNGVVMVPPYPVPVPVPVPVPEQQQQGPKKQQPEGNSDAAAPPTADSSPLGFFDSAGWRPTGAQLIKLQEIADRHGLDLELQVMKIADWLRTPQGRKQQCSFRLVADWLDREQSNGSNGHGENRQRPGGVGQGPRRANAGAGGGAAGEIDPFAKYVRSDEFPNGRADGP